MFNVEKHEIREFKDLLREQATASIDQRNAEKAFYREEKLDVVSGVQARQQEDPGWSSAEHGASNINLFFLYFILAQRFEVLLQNFVLRDLIKLQKLVDLHVGVLLVEKLEIGGFLKVPVVIAHIIIIY